MPKRIEWWHYVLPSELVERMKKVVPTTKQTPSSRYRSLHDFVIQTIERRVEELEKLKK